jgi:ABC-type Mn2+/Zn2+ transport system permease subunit
MSRRIQFGVFVFGKMEFLVEQGIGTIILRVIGFTYKHHNYVRFDPTTTKVDDIAIGVLHVGFFMKVVIWLKTCSDVNGQ